MIKRFFAYYRPHLPLFGVDFCSALVLAGLELIFPLAVRRVVDDLLPRGDIPLLLWAGGGLLLLYAAGYGLRYTVEYIGHVLGARIEYDMRRDLFHHLQKLAVRYFDDTKTGHIMSRIVNDLNEISELAHHGPEGIFLAAITMAGSFFILLLVNWQLTLIAFLFVPLMVWFAVARNKQMRGNFRETRRKIADINAQVEDSIAGIRLVKSFANEGYEEEKFRQGNAGFLTIREEAFKILGSYQGGVAFFSHLINLVVLISGSVFCYYGRLTTGELIGFLLYISVFLQPVERIAILAEMYQKGMAGFQRFLEIMDMEPDIVDTADAAPLSGVRGQIVFDDVTFSYNDQKQVLHNIKLTINPGETVAFVGPSGAGKTTLCSLLPRFYEVDRGSITIDGRDIRQVTQQSLRAAIGMVQQDAFLFSTTIRQNIAYGRTGATDKEIVAAAKLANAHEFICELEHGYDTFIGERGVKLSGGQKQRLAIARIFLKNPPILVLDEATSALDNNTERLIQQALVKLFKNRTTLVIAHRLATIRNADRIVVLTDEGILEEGSHEVLMTKAGFYARLYAAQFDGYLPDSA